MSFEIWNILLSTKQFLENYFPDIKIIIIYTAETINNINLIKNIINNEDIIIISGGGYFGLYEHIIREQVNIIKNFPKNQILFFPCSIYVNKVKKDEYSHFLDVFNHHHHLTFFIRDEVSYNISKALFQNSEIYKVPDIVTRLNLNFLNNITNNRSGILLILRNDELLLSQENRKFIKKITQKYFNNEIYQIDSNNFKIPFGSNRKNETINFIKLIRSKKLVITDRLHGMIFSIITDTPNIVFGNNYHKVESSYYSWFYNIPFCIFIKKEEIVNKLEKTILKLNNLKSNNNFNSKIFQKYYILMRNIISKKLYESKNRL